MAKSSLQKKYIKMIEPLFLVWSCSLLSDALQLLYRCVQAVNITHDAVHAQMDVKLRSLICMGLNEQVLHLWLEVLGSSISSIQKWFD